MSNPTTHANHPKNEEGVRIAENWRPIQDATQLFQGKSQERIAAVHLTPAQRGQAAQVKVHFTVENVRVKKTSQGTAVPSLEGDITLRRFLAYDGLRFVAGNVELRRCADQPVLLDALIRGLEQVTDHDGTPVSRLHLSGKNQITLLSSGKGWTDLTPKGRVQVHVIDVDRVTDEIYGFRAQTDGRRMELVKVRASDRGDVFNPTRWNTVAVVPGAGKTEFADASRLVRDAEGALRLQVAFSDGMTRGAAFFANGEVRWTDPSPDDHTVLARFWTGGKTGIVAQRETDKGTAFSFYPPGELPKAYQPYAAAP